MNNNHRPSKSLEMPAQIGFALLLARFSAAAAGEPLLGAFFSWSRNASLSGVSLRLSGFLALFAAMSNLGSRSSHL